MAWKAQRGEIHRDEKPQAGRTSHHKKRYDFEGTFDTVIGKVTVEKNQLADSMSNHPWETPH